MRQFLSSVRTFLIEEDGPTAVEYAVMAVLIIVVVIQTVKAIGSQTKTLFQTSRDAMS
jgi:pilus assembly protein Flp/PilA